MGFLSSPTHPTDSNLSDFNIRTCFIILSTGKNVCPIEQQYNQLRSFRQLNITTHFFLRFLRSTEYTVHHHVSERTLMSKKRTHSVQTAKKMNRQKFAFSIEEMTAMTTPSRVVLLARNVEVILTYILPYAGWP